jgi:hypothetical protein
MRNERIDEAHVRVKAQEEEIDKMAHELAHKDSKLKCCKIDWEN